MKKETVYIVLSHKHVIKNPGNKTTKPVWDRVESVEFVSQLRNKHYTASTAIGDYINRKMLSGSRAGLGDYSQFENYIRNNYEKEMKQLDDAYLSEQVLEEVVHTPEVLTDEFGNTRVKTVFDKIAN